MTGQSSQSRSGTPAAYSEAKRRRKEKEARKRALRIARANRRQRLPMSAREREAAAKRAAPERASCRIGINDHLPLEASRMNPNRGQLRYRLDGNAHTIRR